MRNLSWAVLVMGLALVVAGCGSQKAVAVPTPAGLEAGQPTFLFLFNEP
ncbi:MAG: hypothetical protein IT330_00305 [Anaerolineae bacterium]|nr:hypothetical protein [Anaerolineae bacterium]